MSALGKERHIYLSNTNSTSLLNPPGSSAPERSDGESVESPHSQIEVEHDLFNSVIGRDQGKVASPHSHATPSSQGANDEHQDVEPAPRPSDATPTHRERHPEKGSPVTSNRGSVDSVDTVRGVEVKRSPKRRETVDEDDPMDDGELADSESDDHPWVNR